MISYSLNLRKSPSVDIPDDIGKAPNVTEEQQTALRFAVTYATGHILGYFDKTTQLSMAYDVLNMLIRQETTLEQVENFVKRFSKECLPNANIEKHTILFERFADELKLIYHYSHQSYNDIHELAPFKFWDVEFFSSYIPLEIKEEQTTQNRVAFREHTKEAMDFNNASEYSELEKVKDYYKEHYLRFIEKQTVSYVSTVILLQLDSEQALTNVTSQEVDKYINILEGMKVFICNDKESFISLLPPNLKLQTFWCWYDTHGNPKENNEQIGLENNSTHILSKAQKIAIENIFTARSESKTIEILSDSEVNFKRNTTPPHERKNKNNDESQCKNAFQQWMSKGWEPVKQEIFSSNAKDGKYTTKAKEEKKAKKEIQISY